MSFEQESKKKRFLREGVLNEMIRQLQEWDRDSLKAVSNPPTLASLIQLFETSKLVLNQVESQIEAMKQEHPKCARQLTVIAYILQTGLRNAFVGIEDERVNIRN